MKGLVAIVTGASRGIGRAIAEGYGAEGARVAAIARPNSPAGLPGTVYETVKRIVQAGGEAIAVPCDVTDEKQVKSMVMQVSDRLGQIDVLVNNAALFFVRMPSWEIEPERWQQLINVNLMGPYLVCREVVPLMIARRSGSIINIGSQAATIARPGGADYCSSKAALHMFSLSLAQEVQEYNIAVNVLCPGGIKTETALVSGWPPAWHERVEPEEVVPSAIYLALQSAKSFTGRIVSRTDFGKNWPW
ncbi:MAG: SDR family oxidoreductase [Chloroflexi bacterium]|nr:SDR family oxidoreductase [Chloroflexota bacterium]